MITVVVPTLDEEARIGECLGRLAAEAGLLEVLVCDGGSRDRTREVAASFEGVRVLEAGRGRAVQMNAGAAEARGDVLWFLHADSKVAPGSVAALRAALADPEVVGGAFRFAVDGPGWIFRGLELCVRLRSELLGVPYGDQGYFVRRLEFERVGGYPEVPVMEDLYLLRALRALGRFPTLPVPLETSARRWQRDGVLRTTVRNLGLVLRDWLGVLPWQEPGRGAADGRRRRR